MFNSPWLDLAANAAFIGGIVALCLIAIAALICVLARDSENDQ